MRYGSTFWCARIDDSVESLEDIRSTSNEQFTTIEKVYARKGNEWQSIFQGAASFGQGRHGDGLQRGN